MIDFKYIFESIQTYKYTNEDLDNFPKEEFYPIILVILVILGRLNVE